MEIKKSVVKNVQANGTWDSKRDGKMYYKHEIEFENGDMGEYSSVKQDQDKFVVGQEVDYEHHTNTGEYGAQFTKIKPIYSPPSNNGFSKNGSTMSKEEWAKKDAMKQYSISKQCSLKAAVEFYSDIKQPSIVDKEDVICLAKYFHDWLQDDDLKKERDYDKRIEVINETKEALDSEFKEVGKDPF